VHCDVRIIAATNVGLVEAVKNGAFRKDLYYRLNTFPITLPPLRERKEDIPALVDHFITQFCAGLNRKKMEVSEALLCRLINHNWPGNIRELQNIVNRLCILSSDEILVEVDNLFEDEETSHVEVGEKCFPTLEENERYYVLKVLQHCDWRVFGATGAAEIMDMNPRTLISRMKKLNINKPSNIQDEPH
jgi:transcriptional regulator with GAF, ATPase, and Fis domain